MKFHRTSSTLASVSLAIASIVGFSAVTLSAQSPESAIAQEAAPTVTTKSSISDIALARHLSAIGAKLYTAYWCPHCHHQKQSFGEYAVQLLDVVECDQRGINPQTELCRDKRIKGYPTWEINGQLYPGNRSFEDLAELSGYQR
ncbi:MAG: protein disulfide isomerase family protein [Pseudanabaena sp. ELA748]